MPSSTAVAERPVEILLAEDNKTDAALLKTVLKHCKLSVRLNAVQSGEYALAFLHRQGIFSAVPEPDLILLDLTLPRMSGWDVLSEIKRDPELNRIPVLIVTGSQNEEDVRRAYLMHVDSYLVKPLNMLEFPILTATIERILRNSQPGMS